MPRVTLEQLATLGLAHGSASDALSELGEEIPSAIDGGSSCRALAALAICERLDRIAEALEAANRIARDGD